MKRPLSALLGITALSGGIVVAASPAMAHDTPTIIVECPTSAESQARHRCGSTAVRVSHRQIIVCDDVADNNGVRTNYQLRDGSVGFVGDSNGSQAPWGSDFVTVSSNPIIFFEVCAGVDGRNSWCSDWVAA